jgi:hypothetical protein
VKLLNLDELARKERAIVLFGQEYEIREMSVGAFIDSMAKASQIEKRVAAGEQIEPSEQMEAMVEAVRFGIPDLKQEVARRLSFDQLTTLIRFMNGDLDPETPAEPATPSEEGGAEKKS